MLRGDVELAAMIPRSDPVLRRLVEAQRAIPAIKHLRDTYGMDLVTARNLYDELKQEFRLQPHQPPHKLPRTTPLWLLGITGVIAIAIFYFVWLRR